MELESEKMESLYPMYFGASCAFLALNLLSNHETHDQTWAKVTENLLQGSAQLLGLLVWNIQGQGTTQELHHHKLEKEIDELKKRRREDAKANEKVVSIFAAQEQSWFAERRKLRQNIGALMNELRVSDKKKTDKVQEIELLLQSKDKALSEEQSTRKELEIKLAKSEEVAKRVALEHKTAFIELVSSQRQLEAEMGRALRQVEAARQELASVSEQRDESMLMVQELSAEMVKMHHDSEQKEKILSAMMRKSKLDSAEKQLLLKEIKSSKRSRDHPKHSMLTRQSHVGSSNVVGRNRASLYDDSEFGQESRLSSPTSDNQFDDVKRLEGWVQSEAEKYGTMVEQRHQIEIDAFAEQMRLKDEKLEAFHWKLLSMELETKRLKSHIEGLNHDMSQLRHDNVRLEALLMEREEELSSLKEQVVSHLKLLNRSKTQDQVKKKDQYKENECKEVVLVVQSPEGELDGKAGPIVAIESQVLAKTDKSPWRMDLNALGVSYKIKRLKQQLLLLERLAGKQDSGEETEGDENERFGTTGLVSLLNKQVVRYQSLQGKIDDLCKRLHGNEPDLYRGESNITGRTKGETRTLEHYLEETFQLQRYIVATGQKMVEIQTKISSEFVGVTEELDNSATFDRKRFGDGMRNLFQEVQRGLEVRIARVIGDLEGTLACEGMIHLRR